jgi:putative DNA-invertase from lambdoid prophage Rac
MTSRTVLYCRVSVSEQAVAHQISMALHVGLKADKTIVAAGVSGISTRLAERDQGRRLFDLLRRGDVLVVRWLDRLRRSYADVVDTLRVFLRRVVVVRTIVCGSLRWAFLLVLSVTAWSGNAYTMI